MYTLGPKAEGKKLRETFSLYTVFFLPAFVWEFYLFFFFFFADGSNTGSVTNPTESFPLLKKKKKKMKTRTREEVYVRTAVWARGRWSAGGLRSSG